ncbi:MAG TPA: hypothetical protein PKN50_03560 [Spirochaetota bacterium]|nr:hypothetical protein [Spirochaetota bacterium]HPV41463.1 hypothetical protein [Spirochaetota bacterium]
MNNSERKSRRGKRILRIIGMVLAGVAFAILFALVFGLIVQYLWNWVMPDLFGLKAVTYWQAFALVILAKIFFGSFSRHHGRSGPGCGPRPWPGHGPGSLSRDERKHFVTYWQEEGRTAFEAYMKRMDAGNAGKE